MMTLPVRKHPRLKDYDYGAGGVFFVTICTRGKEKILGHVVGGDPATVALSSLGLIVRELIDSIPLAHPSVVVHCSVVMPNHVHILLQILKPSPVSLFTVVRGLKALATKRWGEPVWQSSFYEHVIRNEAEALQCWKYIEENPLKWSLDQYF